MSLNSFSSSSSSSSSSTSSTSTSSDTSIKDILHLLEQFQKSRMIEIKKDYQTITGMTDDESQKFMDNKVETAKQKAEQDVLQMIQNLKLTPERQKNFMSVMEKTKSKRQSQIDSILKTSFSQSNEKIQSLIRSFDEGIESLEDASGA